MAQKLQENVHPSSTSIVPTTLPRGGRVREGLSGGSTESSRTLPRGSLSAASTASSTLWTLRGVRAAPKSAARSSLLQFMSVRQPATTIGFPSPASSSRRLTILFSVGDFTPHVFNIITSEPSG